MSGERPSRLVGILDGAAALDFDAAIATHLYLFEDERKWERMRAAAGFAGGGAAGPPPRDDEAAVIVDGKVRGYYSAPEV